MGLVGSTGVALLSALTLSACDKHEPASRAAPTPGKSVGPTPPPSSAATASRPSSAASAGAAPSAEPKPSTHHCPALGKKTSAELHPIPEEEVQLAVEGDDVYALGYTHALARSRLYRFTRDGGVPEVVAEQKGLGERKHFSLQGGAGYFVQSGKLFKLGPAPQAAQLLREDVQSPTAVVGDRVLVIACDSKSKADHVLRLPTAGGDAESLADLPRASADRCQYSSVVADERDVFIADWRGSQIFAVSLSDKAVRVVVAKRGFPGPLLLEPDALVYASALGLFRLARAGGTPTRLADTNQALAPYSLIAASRSDYWVFDNIVYTIPIVLYWLPRAGGDSKSFMTLHNADPNVESYEGDGLSDFVVDDECVYVTQNQY
ncbi:MAG TPA: hypothetical protein VNG33_00745, partial [Polyangiaceae bacterium]|nr:hypothetical protein [Polyangiaceae bacterium]